MPNTSYIRRTAAVWAAAALLGADAMRQAQEFSDVDVEDTEGRRRKTKQAPSKPLDADGQRVGPHCQSYLRAKNMAGPTELYNELSDYKEVHSSGAEYNWKMPCAMNKTAHEFYHPNPKSPIPGVTDTTDMTCRFGSINLHKVYKQSEKHDMDDLRKDGDTCCGARPHFQWIVATCEKRGRGEGQFCAPIPDCAKTGAPKINYVAAYQFNGKEFIMLEKETAGELDSSGVSGDYWKGKGFVRVNKSFSWRGGDWTTKYAPAATGDTKGIDGPRGVTPPAGLWVLSAENFYYGAFYMLHQVNVNLEAKGNPTESGNCWLWELDPVEGSVGWHKEGTNGPGNLNMLYGTNNAQTSGCMPLSYQAKQMNGLRGEFLEPQMFKENCEKNPGEYGCKPWKNTIDWSGGKPGSQRFEQYWDKPYVFAVVLDHQGSWTYRWIPEADGSTGWPGIKRNSAAKVLQARPRKITEVNGLRSDVRGDTKESVILQPSLPKEASCLRSSVEATNWAFGSEALASMASHLGEMQGLHGRFAGAQNWWEHFVDTKQYQDYPISIMGVPKDIVQSQTYTCNGPDTWRCDCKAPPEPMPGSPELAARLEEFERKKAAEKAAKRARGPKEKKKGSGRVGEE